jgi:DNA (cytosine-5)-methyltransferase 1
MLNTFASLFSGGGGADTGAIQAGLKPVFGVEYNARIAEYYALNIGAHCTVAKVQDVNPYEFESVDWLHASPVCKNFSTAKTDGEETEEDRATATATANFIRVLMPKIFSLENVYAYRNSQSFEIILAELKRLGYRWQFEHVCAADYGVPQTRMRLILIATRKDLPRYQWPEQTRHDGQGYSDIWGNVVKPWIGWYEAIEDLIPSLPESKFAKWQLERLPELPDNYLIGQDYGSPNTVENRELSIKEMDEPSFTVKASASNGLGAKAFVLDGQPAFNGEGLTCRQSEERFFTLSASMDKRPSRAWLTGEPFSGNEELIAANNLKLARAWLSQGRVVQMTPRALARFQSFPDWYKLPEKNALACEIIGNAVPCLMFQRFVEQGIRQYGRVAA